MAFRVSTAAFEGPFELLLRLVTRQKVDIGSVSISSIAEQYLEQVGRLSDLDLDVASDFVLVASTLLDLKAASLLPTEEGEPLDDDLADLTPEEIRDVLVARLIAYRQFRSAATALAARQRAEARMHPRTAGPDPGFLCRMPDYLEGVPLDELGRICAGFFARRETLLLESEHIAARRVPLETRVEQVDALIRHLRSLTFDDLLADDPSVENRVVSLLAVLELSKRNAVTLDQREAFGPIGIEAVEGAPAFVAELDAGGLSSELGSDDDLAGGPAPTEHAPAQRSSHAD